MAMQDEATEVRTLRCFLGLTQGQLARELGVTRQTVSGWEAGRGRVPRVARLALRLLILDNLKPP